MDLSAGALFSSLVIGLMGFGLMMYGKKSERIAPFVGGAAMCVFPYFVHSLILTWLGAGACLAGTWALNKFT